MNGFPELSSDLSFWCVIFGTVFCFMFSFPLFRLKYLQGSANESSFGKIFEMLLGIIPADIIAPFPDGNTLQIIFTAAFMAALLAIATPPIPGGGVVAYTILFNRLGIPDDALAILLSVDILFDFVDTASNMYNLPLMLSNVALRMGLLNCEVLRKKKLLNDRSQNDFRRKAAASLCSCIHLFV